MYRRGATHTGIIAVILLIIAVLLVLGLLAWYGCSKKRDAASSAKSSTPPPRAERQPEDQSAGPSPETRGVPAGSQAAEGAEAEPADAASGQGSPGRPTAGSSAGKTDSKAQAARPSAPGAEAGGTNAQGNGSAGTSAGATPGDGGSGNGDKGVAGDLPAGGRSGGGNGGPGAAGRDGNRAGRRALDSDAAAGDPLADAGLSPDELSQSLAAARDAAAKARQAAGRGDYPKAFRSALAGWQRVRPLAKSDRQAAALAEELFRLVQQYGKSLEANAEPTVPMDSTPLITR